MIIPVRCFTCGKVVGSAYSEFHQRVTVGGEDGQKVLDELGFERYCCRRMLVAHADLIGDIAKLG